MTETVRVDVAVVGAGPAGLATALALARCGWRVAVLERSRGRRRRLCGEFLSGDGWLALEALGVAEALQGCPRVHRVRVTTSLGACWESQVEGLGRGCSRALLAGTLEAACRDAGVGVVRGWNARPGRPEGWRASLTIWAGGQSGAAALQRGRSPTGTGASRDRGRQTGKVGGHLGVAVHGRPRGPVGAGTRGTRDGGDCVRLHAVPGGYVGIGPVEAGRVNICGLLPASWMAPGDPLSALAQAKGHNEFLRNELRNVDLDSESVVTVGGLDFARQRPAVPLSVGDQAAAPAPVLGQGLASALRGGRLLAAWTDRHLRGEIDAAELAVGYRQAWDAEFARRLQLGRWLHAGLLRPGLAATTLAALTRLPGMGRRLVRWTRGPLADPCPLPPAPARGGRAGSP